MHEAENKCNNYYVIIIKIIDIYSAKINFVIYQKPVMLIKTKVCKKLTN